MSQNMRWRLRTVCIVVTLAAPRVVLAIDTDSGKDTTSIGDGQSDYRYTQAYGISNTNFCTPFEPQYISKYKSNEKLKMGQGDGVSIFLKKAYFSKVQGGWLSNKAEAAILVNTDINAPQALKNPGDYGRLVYYSDAVSEQSNANESFVFGDEIAKQTSYLRLDVAVIQFESANSVVAKSLLKTIVNIGAATVSPAVAPVLNSIGNTLATANSGGKRTTQYRMGFLVDSEKAEVRQPILREGDMVLITSRLPERPINWSNLYFDHKSGNLMSPNEKYAKHSFDMLVDEAKKLQRANNQDEKEFDICKYMDVVKDLDYLVFTFRKNVPIGADTTKVQTLGDVIDLARSRTTTIQQAVAVVTDQVQNVLGSDSAKQAIYSYKNTVSAGTKSLYLQSLATMLACGGNGNTGTDCAGAKVTDQRTFQDIERRVLEEGIMCKSELDNLVKNQNAGAAGGPSISSIVDATMKAIGTRGNRECP